MQTRLRVFSSFSLHVCTSETLKSKLLFHTTVMVKLTAFIVKEESTSPPSTSGPDAERAAEVTHGLTHVSRLLQGIP